MSTPTVIRATLAPKVAQYPQQSLPLEGTEADGQTAAYASPAWIETKTLPQPLAANVAGLFESGLAQAKDKPLLGYRKLLTKDPATYEEAYTWITYAEVDKRRRAVGSALHDMFSSGKLTASDFETVGIWSINRPEWQLVDIAIQSYSKVSVALYDTLGPDAVEYIINHAETSIIFISEKSLDSLLKIAPKCPVVKVVVCFDELEEETNTTYTQAAKEAGVELLSFSKFEAFGAEKLIDPIPAGLDDVSTICYTSGTTSTPKGVVLTHRNLVSAMVSNASGICDRLPENWVMISYLPLAHIYGRGLELVAMALGGAIGYYTGNPLNLLNDIKLLRPHFFPSVPRVLNRIYLAVMANTTAPGLKGFLFRWAVSSKLARLTSSGVTTHMLWDMIIFKKVQAALGGRCEFITSGSAPIVPDVLNFFKIAFSCDVVEGYGLTETCATCARVWADDNAAGGSIGGVQPVNQIKLFDVPELLYTSKDTPNPRGELCIKGDNVFTKYYKDPENTSKALDSDGWFHTGDIGEVDSAGRFKIIDRVKNIMKLSQGEYVALEKIENLYSTVPVVAQVYIHGDSLQDHLIAVVVPDPKVLAELAGAAGYKFDPTSEKAVEEACKNDVVIKAVLDDTVARGKKAGLKGFEIAKAVYLTTTQFTVENETMTPTFKIVRKKAYNLHKEELDGIYAKAAKKVACQTTT